MPASPQQFLALLKTFPWDEWNAKLAPGLSQPYRDVVVASGQQAAKKIGGAFDRDDPFVQRFMTRYVGERIKQLDKTTKDDVRELIRARMAEAGLGTVGELGDLVAAAVRDRYAEYEDWRADRIARTETGYAGNHGDVLGFAQNDISEVEVIDGTQDEICEGANGQVWPLTMALAQALGHPNCTRVFSARLPEDREHRRGTYARWAFDTDVDLLAVSCALFAEFTGSLDDPTPWLREVDEEDQLVDE